MRLQQMEVSCETKTKDNVFVLIRVAVQYQVNDDEESIKNAHYRLTNPKQQIESYVFDVVRSSVPKIDLDDVFTTKEEIAQNIKSELTSAMSSFGYTILASPITDIDPDKEVKRAMNDINKAKRLRLAAQDEGEAVKIKAVKEAEAEAARTEIQAKADAEAKFLAGQGIARQRQAIMEGLRESVNAFKSEVQDVDAKTVMDLMIVTQYFDMMRDVGAHSKTNAVFLNHSPGAPGEWLRKTALVLLWAPTSRIMSKYCVTIIRSMTVLASTSCTSLLKALTDSRSPSMMACRWRAMPCPARNLASASAFAWISVRAASASASLTALILTASPSSCAARRSRFALLMSFIARLTSLSGSMSVMGEARMV